MKIFARQASVFLLGFCLVSFGYAQVETNEAVERLIRAYQASGSEQDGSLAAGLVRWTKHQRGMDWFVDQAVKTDNSQTNYFAGEALKELSPEKALGFYKKARVQGSISATLALADMYYEGDGVKQDKKAGCELYREGVPSALPTNRASELAKCFDPQFEVIAGFQQSPADARKWYRVAAEHEERQSQDSTYKLTLRQRIALAYLYYGICLSDALYGQTDLKASAAWIQKSSDMKNRYAMYLHAENLLEGVGILQDTSTALKYLLESASLGETTAQNRIGIFYAEGKSTPKNLVEAYKWFLIASANGYENSKTNKEKAEKSLSEVEILRGRGMAKKWLDENQAERK